MNNLCNSERPCTALNYDSKRNPVNYKAVMPDKSPSLAAMLTMIKFIDTNSLNLTIMGTSLPQKISIYFL